MSDETPPRPAPSGWTPPADPTPGWRPAPPPSTAASGWAPAAPPTPTAWSPPIPVADLQPQPAPRAPHPWRWATALVVIVAVVVATAVVTTRGGGHEQTPLEVLAAASSATTAAGGAHVSSVETVSFGGRSIEVVRIEGNTNWAQKTSDLYMSSRERTVLDIRQIGTLTYMSVPMRPLPSGAQWVVIRPSDVKVGAGEAVLGTNDPTAGLRYLSALKGDPKVVGTGMIDGIDTTHYSSTVDLRSYIDRVAKAQSAFGGGGKGAPALGELDGLVDLHKLPADVWIDRDGRVRRFQITISATIQGQTEKVVDVMTFSQFDAGFNVLTPSASDTAPFSQLPDLLKALNAASSPSTT